MPWRCPLCGRSFGRRAQPHSCVPAADLDDWLSGRPPVVADVVAAVRTVVTSLGDEVRLEATKSVVMVKRARTFAEVKPRRATVEVAFIVSRRIDDPRVVRTLDLTATRIVHVLEMSAASDVDDQVQGWLAEAYEGSPL
jgi:ribonuclease HII